MILNINVLDSNGPSIAVGILAMQSIMYSMPISTYVETYIYQDIVCISAASTCAGNSADPGHELTRT